MELGGEQKRVVCFGKRQADLRRDGRATVTLRATARLLAGEPVEFEVVNLSAGGFLGTIPLNVQIGTMLRIGLPTGRAPHAVVVRLSGPQAGCEFLSPLDAEDVDALVAH